MIILKEENILKSLDLIIEGAQDLKGLIGGGVIINPEPKEKKARKKRVKKEKTVMLGPLHTVLPESTLLNKPKRGRRARHAFVEPKLREGETPV